MGAAELIARGRAAAVRYMEQAGTTITVARNTGALDPVTFDPVLTTVYAGIGRVQTYEPVQRDVEVGGGSAAVQRYSVHVPVEAFAPKIGDVITVTACALDANLVGREFVVRGLLHKGASTAYRMVVDDDNGFGEG